MDLSKSVILDIRKQCGNEEKAASALKGMKDQQENEKIKKIRELAKAFEIKDNSKDQLIENVLQTCKWDVEKAFGPMLEALEADRKSKKDQKDDKKSWSEERGKSVHVQFISDGSS